MRIAVIGCRGVPSNYSGIEKIVENLFGLMARNGHEITVYCRPMVPRMPDDAWLGLHQKFIPAPGGKYGETVSHSILSMAHALMRGDRLGRPFDLISLHAIAPNVAAPLAAAAGIPVISHVHGLDWQREKWKGLGSRVIQLGERAMVRSAAAVVVVNRALKHYYETTYGIPTALLPNGISITPDQLPIDTQVLGRFHLIPGRFIVAIGRLVPEKRLQDTIGAFRRLATDFKLAIVGDGSTTPDYVRSLHEACAGDDRIVFTGQQSGSALETLFRAAAFYVTASELEGLPSSLLECMERGTCAIASDIPPHRELLERVEGYDLFFPVGDVDTLTRHMQRLLSQPSQAAALGAAARRFVRREYAWPVLAERTERFYQWVLKSEDRRNLPEFASAGV